MYCQHVLYLQLSWQDEYSVSLCILQVFPGTASYLIKLFSTWALLVTMLTFLDLPLEVRLQIYRNIIEANPISNQHLAMRSKDQEIRQDYMRSLGQTTPRSLVIQRQVSANEAIGICILTPMSQPQRLSNNHGGKIPTSFLTSCTQVCQECRALPWELNQFTFINWFWSGIYAAQQFSRSLTSWQLGSLRYVGIEVLTRDLRGGDTTKMYGERSKEEAASKSEWEELCASWQGVWGLRLAVKGCSKNKMTTNSDSSELYIRPEERVYAGMLTKIGTVVEDRGVLDINASWIRRGLCEMKSLKWVEIEIEDEGVPRGKKLQFCKKLADVLGVRQDGRVKVILVEMVEPTPIPNKDLKWIGGPPGDDSIDGS